MLFGFRFAVIAALLLPLQCIARQVSVTVHLEDEFLRQLLITQVFTQPNESARVLDDGRGCNSLVISRPQVASRSSGVTTLSTGQARVGTPLSNKCLSVINWDGFVEVIQEPRLSQEDHIIQLRVLDSNVYGTDMRKHLGTGKIWDWVKRYVHPSVEALTIDLQPALDDLGTLLPLVLPSDDNERLQRLLASLTLNDVRTDEAGLALTLSFELEETVEAAQAAAEPPLSADELEQWEIAWRGWDAFLTFVVKHAAASTSRVEFRSELLTVLIKARHDLLDALAAPERRGSDPVRKLFVETWTRLAPVLRDLSTDLPGATAMRYLSFIAAADALHAIDELGPGTGLEISLEGLRRLARIVAPTVSGDPLIYDLEVDPELRELFDFGPPLPPAQPNPDVDTRGSWISRVWAATKLDAVLVRTLNSWVPDPSEIEVYLPMVGQLLNQVIEVTLEGPRLASEYHELYRPLVLATAWQETCWRQFIKRNGKLVPIRSSAGAVGIMQVVPRVWRGFYDPTGLRNDIGYNASAGSEILVHYLVDYSIAKGEHKRSGNLDDLVRATYAAYNGGPRHLTRYRRSDTPQRLRQIDQSFWDKYSAVRDGDELAVARCFQESTT